MCEMILMCMDKCSTQICVCVWYVKESIDWWLLVFLSSYFAVDRYIHWKYSKEDNRNRRIIYFKTILSEQLSLYMWLWRNYDHDLLH